MARLDATEILRNQHREAQAVFALFQDHPDADTRRQMAQVLVKKLSIHAAVEELVLYPVLRQRVEGGDAMYRRSLDEHQELKELLAGLDRMVSSGSQDIAGLVGELHRAVEAHVAEEEGEVFPALRRALSRDELADLGAELTREEAGAPTHPHPHAPATPPANRYADAAAAVLDKARDLVSRAR